MYYYVVQPFDDVSLNLNKPASLVGYNSLEFTLFDMFSRIGLGYLS